MYNLFRFAILIKLNTFY